MPAKDYSRMVDYVDVPRFMGTWYVIAGRTTSFEKGAHNATEKYSWNAENDRIDVDFTFHKNAFDGELKSMTQKAWIEDKKTNAHWKIQPFWPLKFNYLVVGLDPDYQWTAIGVPDGEYLWIMARSQDFPAAKVQTILDQLKKSDYPVEQVEFVPQKKIN